ncbi:hypothetical protein DR62_06075 [Burkholderia thailandensis]|nr:hypothetical protein DR62_06075 [Burkholderia thailandensis]AOI50412.1 hypothetical protein WI24_00405 [Burkholderia thailandensis]AOJ55134.1 hypothetical protein AQ477_00415 [Burkholderia thailandensis]KXF60864.1 hypothetical protein AQ476_05905 [Burkholderia thailandensis]PNE75068.1 hypothetical protein A8H37_25540 [Burkholderia thailandensis]
MRGLRPQAAMRHHAAHAAHGRAASLAANASRHRVVFLRNPERRFDAAFASIRAAPNGRSRATPPGDGRRVPLVRMQSIAPASDSRPLASKRAEMG